MNTLPLYARRELEEALIETSHNNKFNLILALSYSSRWELVNAVKNIAIDVKAGKLMPQNITQDTLQSYLATSGFPDPELMIRTSGEYRISNFFIIPTSICRTVFHHHTLAGFQERSIFSKPYSISSVVARRFGKTDEQLIGQPHESLLH
jgi:undecaprenyl diphosphate synthase